MTSTVLRTPRMPDWLALAGLLLLVFLVAAAGSYFTLPKIPTWYAGLSKPAFAPPNWIFGPVWTVLYLLMAIAAWRIWLTPPATMRTEALVLFLIQLALNAAWSPIFFGLESPRGGLAILIVLFVALSWTAIAFLRQEPVAAALLIPYLAWVAFATVLNVSIVALN